MEVELHFKSGAEAFRSLANLASKESCFAFFVNDLRNFELAIGEEHSIFLHQTEGAFDQLKTFQQKSTQRIAGYIGYDLKNDLEELKSNHPSALNFPEAVFFEPSAWVTCKDGFVQIRSNSSDYCRKLTRSLNQQENNAPKKEGFSHDIYPETSRDEYLKNADKFRYHLQRGDIYEANYCIQFSGAVQSFDVVEQFISLQSRTEAPFSVFAGLKGHFILSASPERYLKNQGGQLTSQPIKGTKKRSDDPKLDALYKEQLRLDQKEQSENVMIVDLVRNDLSRIAQRGSVRVTNLFESKTFKTVHHLVSTVRAQLNTEKFNHWDAIKASFPMGSMTGAPKISAMKLIEQYEGFKRSAYSGGFGWMDPNGDFDFNVMIRTIYYNKMQSRLSFAVGSALTIKAIPDDEYEECLLKAKALIESLESARIGHGITSSV